METCPPTPFESLAAMPLVRQYEEAFFKATGVALKLRPAGVPEARRPASRCENGVCWLMTHRPEMGMVCWKPDPAAGSSPANRQTLHCFAGLQSITAPVHVAGRHVATWVGDHMLSRRPTQEELESLARRFESWGMAGRFSQVSETFQRGRVIPSEQFSAMGQLLALFAEHLGRSAEPAVAQAGSAETAEPRMVRLAKEFVAAHLTERLSLGDVAAAVNVSSFHFCRVFHAATGVKFTEYVARLRVERAKSLLANRTARVTEVAYDSGFGSIPQFNAVFRKHVGASPTEFRANTRSDSVEYAQQDFSGDSQ